MNLFSTQGTLLLLFLQLSANASQSKWTEENNDHDKIMNLEEKHLRNDLNNFFKRKDSEKYPKKNKKFNTVKMVFPVKKNNQIPNMTRKKTNR